MASREHRPGRRHGGGDGHVQFPAPVGPELEPGLLQGEPVGGGGDRFPAQQPHDGVERVGRHRAGVERVDAHHEGVGRQLARSDAEHGAAPGLLVELADPVGEDQRLVVGEGVDPGAEHDPAGAFGGRGQEHLGRGDDLVAGGVVFAGPQFLVAEPVEVGGQVEVPAQLERGVTVGPVVRGEEHPESVREIRLRLLRHVRWPSLGGACSAPGSDETPTGPRLQCRRVRPPTEWEDFRGPPLSRRSAAAQL